MNRATSVRSPSTAASSTAIVFPSAADAAGPTGASIVSDRGVSAPSSMATTVAARSAFVAWKRSVTFEPLGTWRTRDGGRNRVPPPRYSGSVATASSDDSAGASTTINRSPRSRASPPRISTSRSSPTPLRRWPNACAPSVTPPRMPIRSVRQGPPRAGFVRRSTISGTSRFASARTRRSTSAPRATFRTPAEKPSASSPVRRGHGVSSRRSMRRVHWSASAGWSHARPAMLATASPPAKAVATSRRRRKSRAGSTSSTTATASSIVRSRSSRSTSVPGPVVSSTAVERLSRKPSCPRSRSDAKLASPIGTASRPHSFPHSIATIPASTRATTRRRTHAGGSTAQSMAIVPKNTTAPATPISANDSIQIQRRVCCRTASMSARIRASPAMADAESGADGDTAKRMSGGTVLSPAAANGGHPFPGRGSIRRASRGAEESIRRTAGRCRARGAGH